MSKNETPNLSGMPKQGKVQKSIRMSLRLRNYFLTGLVIAAPVSITIYLTWAFVQWIDGWVKPIIPDAYNPDTYLPFSVPGGGLVFALLGITLLGFLTAGFVGKTIISYGESVLGRMPLVRNLYQGLKQIFETVLSNSQNSFQEVALLEYPRRGLWAIVFISTAARGEVKKKLADIDDDEMMAIFLPTTPNPTSGFLLFVPRRDLMSIDMTVEQAAKLVISAGLVTPDQYAGQKGKDGEIKAVPAKDGEEAKEFILAEVDKQEDAA